MPKEINLLPPARRSILKRQRVFEAIYRIIGTCAIGLGVITCTGVASAAGLRWFTQASSDSTSDQVIQQSSKLQELQDKARSSNQNFEVVYEIDRTRVVWSPLLQDIFSATPQGVFITGISGVAEKRFEVTFRGNALARNTLVVFEKHLAELPWVAEVVAPHSNLLQRANSEYVFTLVLKQPSQ